MRNSVPRAELFLQSTKQVDVPCTGTEAWTNLGHTTVAKLRHVVQDTSDYLLILDKA